MKQDERKQYLGEPDEYQNPSATQITKLIECTLDVLDAVEELKNQAPECRNVNKAIVYARGLRNELYILREKFEADMLDD